MAIKDEKRKAAKAFAERWKDRGYERGESQSFWIDLLQNVYGVEQPTQIITFEERVKMNTTAFIDAFISSTKVLIEQKSIDKDLRAPIRQSDGSSLTPFQQAKRYAAELPYSSRPRWVVACNFKSFLIYDMEQPHGEPTEILLENLEREYHLLSFLADEGSTHIKREMELSIQAGNLVGKIYEALLGGYREEITETLLRDLNILCVRLVFCMYAEDAGLFPGGRSAFYDYMRQFEPRQMRKALIELFRVMNTPEEDRDPYLKDDDPLLAAFPYCAGGLFREENVHIPNFSDDIATLLLEEASEGFDWNGISPTIFGAVFESTLNPETRRSGGMHYTSVENIHKVIDPLFLDDLNAEFDTIQGEAKGKVRERHLMEFQEKLANLHFLDPACGSGNFLTETYLSLRRLENKVIQELTHGQSLLGFSEVNPIKVNINQFYGIEINDFAVSVAATALWIAEAQTMAETEKIINLPLEYFPLRDYEHIHEANALRIDWNDVIPAKDLDYIMGNPPFVGHQNRDADQIQDMDIVFADFENCGKLDYVAAWYKKAADYIQTTNIQCSFVSTNSICQGESVAVMWEPLFKERKIHINYAYHTFRWDSEASIKAHVHCVIIGFSCVSNTIKYIFDGNQKKEAKNINGYLLDAPNVFVHGRGGLLTPGLPEMTKGSQPTDGGFLFLNEEEKKEMISKYPNSASFIKKFIGASEFLNNIPRYCLWLKGVSPHEYRNIPPIVERLKNVAEMRRNSPTASVQRDAEIPMLFTQIRQPETNYLVIPSHTSENRRYIPFGYESPDTICGNANQILPNASLYLFGVMISNVHMAWMRVVCGRLKSDYRYSPAVYNNFPWPTPTDEQKQKIEQTAQEILDARARYPDCSLADLYDEVTMPPELRKAHQLNDRAVMEAYGFPISRDFTESDCVARLLEMYSELSKK